MTSGASHRGEGSSLAAPVPVSILTGFLGAGKTTLLNRLLADPALAGTAVIVNEFGEIGLDHALIETASDGIIELSDGCLCCTVRGDLVDTLERLLDGTRAIERIVVETTGLADPVPVLRAVMGHPTRGEAMRLDGVVTVLDAVNGAQTLERYVEARRQVAVADRIVLTKADLLDPASPDRRADPTALVRKLNPGAPVLDGAAPASALLECGLYDPATKTLDVARWLREDARSHEHANDHGHSHGHGHSHDVSRHGSVRSFSLRHGPAVSLAAIEDFLNLLATAHGGGMLRMKAIVHAAEHPDEPLVLHAVQTTMHPPVRLPAWPDEDGGTDRATRIVMIVDGVPEAYVRDLFAAFTGQPRIDAPDAEALTRNPLAIPGL